MRNLIQIVLVAITVAAIFAFLADADVFISVLKCSNPDHYFDVGIGTDFIGVATFVPVIYVVTTFAILACNKGRCSRCGWISMLIGLVCVQIGAAAVFIRVLDVWTFEVCSPPQKGLVVFGLFVHIGTALVSMMLAMITGL